MECETNSQCSEGAKSIEMILIEETLTHSQGSCVLMETVRTVTLTLNVNVKTVLNAMEWSSASSSPASVFLDQHDALDSPTIVLKVNRLMNSHHLHAFNASQTWIVNLKRYA